MTLRHTKRAAPRRARAALALALAVAACGPDVALGQGDALSDAMGERAPDAPPPAPAEPPAPAPKDPQAPGPATHVPSSEALTDAPDGAPPPSEEVPPAAPPPWPYLLPILGDDAVSRGFAIPLPIGFNVLANVQRELIDVSDLQVGLGGAPLVDASWVKLRKVETTSESLLARLDVWLLPFLSVYGIAGMTRASTIVEIEQPVILPTTVESQGPTYGFGGTVVAGNEWAFLLVDASWTWTDLDILTSPQQTIVGAARVGHRFTLSEAHDIRLSVWVGVGYETLLGTTKGQLRFGDVLGGKTTLELSPDFQEFVAGLPPEQQADVGKLLGQALVVGTGPDPANAITDFRLKVRPEEPFNMVAGLQLEATTRFTILLEAGFLGTRTSGLASLGVRFGF